MVAVLNKIVVELGYFGSLILAGAAIAWGVLVLPFVLLQPALLAVYPVAALPFFLRRTFARARRRVDTGSYPPIADVSAPMLQAVTSGAVVLGCLGIGFALSSHSAEPIDFFFGPGWVYAWVFVGLGSVVTLSLVYLIGVSARANAADNNGGAT